jgi:PHP domain
VTLLDRRGTWTPEDRAENQCVALDFDVTSEVGAFRADLGFTHRDGTAVLDLGCEGPDRYVGWSGGARDHFVVSDEWSTPGYLPTPVTPGRWRVLVGLHRVPPPGVDYRLTVRAATPSEVAAERDAQPAVPPVPERPPRREFPGADGMRWLAADFHAHTLHSDGTLSIEQLSALAVSRGLDALAVTDHNTTSHHAYLPAVSEQYGIHLVPGQEVTTDRGHANALGDIGFVDFRQPGAQWQRDVEARGGVFSVNHPLATDCCWWMALDHPTRVAEVWHSSWHALPVLHNWGGPLAWWLSSDPRTVPIGGSDFHAYGKDGLPGAPTTWVLTEDDDVLGGVAAGRTAVSADPTGPVLLRLGDELIAVGADGLLLTGFDAGRRGVTGDRAVLPAGEGPWWLEDDQMRVQALCG